MSRLARLQARFTYPGEKLAVIEEFFEGTGAYRGNSVVRAAELGTVNYNIEKRQVGIAKRTRELILPREGLDVIGEVGSVLRRMANVDIFVIGGSGIASPYTGVMHVSSAGGPYSRNLTLTVRGGDVVK